jgi:cytidyltransferase-like protein
MAVGVIIARIQPIHKGHLELIRQALNENENVLLLVGSADKLSNNT